MSIDCQLQIMEFILTVMVVFLLVVSVLRLIVVIFPQPEITPPENREEAISEAVFLIIALSIMLGLLMAMS